MIPKYGPDTPYSGAYFAQTGDTDTKQVELPPEAIAGSDGKSTLALAIRIGIDPDRPDVDLVLAQAIPKVFLDFLRDKDTAGIMRNHIADYLHDVAEQWRSGAIFRG